MAIIQFLQHLFHNGLTEEHRLCAHTELLTILAYSCHLIIIQIDNLPMTAHKSCFLLFQIFGIYALGYFLFTGHDGNVR